MCNGFYRTLWLKTFEHSVRVRWKTFMLMTFCLLIVFTYGFQHYMTLTWLQWHRSYSRMLCFEAKKNTLQFRSRRPRTIKWHCSWPEVTPLRNMKWKCPYQPYIFLESGIHRLLFLSHWTGNKEYRSSRSD